MGHEPEHLVVGHLSKAHGTRGELLLWPLTDRPDELFVPGRRLLVGTEQGGAEGPSIEVEVASVRPFKRGLLLGLAGVADRSAAEVLAGRYLFMPAAELGEPGEGEVYYHQLLGMTVETVEGVQVGRVREVYETEPRHLLEVKGPDRVHLVPFSPEIVRTVDLERGRLVIEPPAGLLEL